jgi:hypothetical protein
MKTDLSKNSSILSITLLMLGLALFSVTCTKDKDTEAADRDALTSKISSDINADSLLYYVTWLQGMGTRFALAQNHRDVASLIAGKLIKMGYTNASLDSFMIDRMYGDVRYQEWQYNVVASIEGTSMPDSVCIVGAHYDDNLRSGNPFDIVPGANDNASGVAAMLEIARVMRKNNFSPKSTIKFVAFGAEELGLYGSTAYAARAIENGEKIRMMLNNDMIAYEPGTDPSLWTVIIKDYDNSHGLRQMAEQMCTRFTSLSYVNDNTYNQQSDSYPFAVQGYKAIFFFSNIMDPGYHTLDDLVTNCNFAYSGEIVKVSCALLVYNN